MRGIIIPCPQKYELLCLENIKAIRGFNCELTIELWEIGNEITGNIKKEMGKYDNIIFKDVSDFCEDPGHWRGFQVKAFALKNTLFDEVILCDADIRFFIHPEIIFGDENYIRTGAYFFKDLDRWQFNDLSYLNTNKFNSLTFFEKRKKFIRNLLPNLTSDFPEEWKYIYDDKVPLKPVKEALQESGVVYMNKKMHKRSIECIYDLNNNHKDTYQYVWGDKETFWIGCLMANNKFTFNHSPGFWYNGCLTHDYKNNIFWKQK